MVRLIKNELYKVFHKKSTYIALIIGMLFLVLINYIYKVDFEEVVYSFIDYGDIALEYEKELKDANLAMTDKVFYQTEVDKNKLLDKYHENWQMDAIEEVYGNALEKYYYAYFNEEMDKLDALKREKDEIENAITSGNYKYFLNLKLANAKNELEEVNGQDASSDMEKLNKKRETERLTESIKLYEYALENDIKNDGSYLGNAIEEMLVNINDVVSYKYPGKNEKKEDFEDGVKAYFENKYIIENKVDTNNNHNLRAVIINFFAEVEIIIFIFIVMIAGSMVSDEFNKGTIKNLLTIPYTRGKIITAKLITCFLMIPFVVICLVLGELLIGGLFFGFSSLSISYVTYNITSNQIISVSPIVYLSLMFLAKVPMLTLLMVLAFAISTIFLNSGLAIAVTFFGYVASSIINLFSERIKILKYFVTTNWQFSDYLFGGTSQFGISLTQSIVVCLIYLSIMLVVIYIVFKKRNVKNI